MSDTDNSEELITTNVECFNIEFIMNRIEK